MTRGIRISRRNALLGMAATASHGALAQSVPSPSVRRKVRIAYWTWADNPNHQQRLVQAVESFNAAQTFIEVALDAGSQTLEVQRKVISAFAAGAGPDVAGTPQAQVQELYDNGILSPIEEYFNKWESKADFYPNIIEAMRSKPGQPLLYLPGAVLTFVLFYRADMFSEANVEPPKTLEEFLAAARTLSQPPNRYGYALRGGDYFGAQILEPLWAGAGSKIVDQTGKADLGGAAAVRVTEQWQSMLTKDQSAPPTAISDRYPQLFSLMERGRCAMWIYAAHGAPALNAALGDRIQATAIPRSGSRDVTLATPTGDCILSSSKNKEAAWEFMMFLGSGAPTRSLGPERGLTPVRMSVANDPAYADNRFLKVAREQAPNWWMPPFHHDKWINYQEKITPFFQEMLRGQLSAPAFNEQANRLLDGKL